MSGNAWINDDWWRDWLFWVGVAVASAVLVLAIAVTDRPWWALVIGWLTSFGTTVCVLGFIRTAVEGYREP